MKLLYIYDQLPTTYQTYMGELLAELKKKVNVKTLSYHKEDKADFIIKSYGLKDKIQRIAYKTKLSTEPSLDIKIMKDFDIVHLQHSYLYPKLTPFISSEKKSKTIITLRGGDTYIKPWINPKWKDFYANKSTHIDAFITVSEHQKAYLQKWGIPENKIYVIPVSFGNKTEAKPKYPSKEQIKIVSAHRMCWEKNIEGNLRVIKLLKEQGYSVSYDIYGDGADKGQVFYLIDKYNLKEEVNYLGKVENEVFKKRLSEYDFFLQLSHSEAFGASVIEAQSQGIPAIISNTDGLTETIQINESGYCVDSFDIDSATKQVIELYKNPKMYYSFSDRAIENSNAKFTTEIEIKKLIDLYKSLIK